MNTTHRGRRAELRANGPEIGKRHIVPPGPPRPKFSPMITHKHEFIHYTHRTIGTSTVRVPICRLCPVTLDEYAGSLK